VADSGKKWLIGCGVGCGAVILLGILLTVGGSLYLMRPFNEAVDAQKELVAEFGGREAYIPPPQGITPDRMEKFLVVRRTVMPMCEKFQELSKSFAAIEELDKGGEEPSKGEVFTVITNLTGNIFGMVGDIGRFTNLRNQALLESGMGLGEYIWIYDSEGGMSGGEQKVMRTLVLNHAEALTSAGMADKAALWEQEADRMKRSETGVPFEGGSLPAEVVRAFLPYERELADLYCEATSSFEMSRVRKKGLSIHSD